jgi:hypothetical protein
MCVPKVFAAAAANVSHAAALLLQVLGANALLLRSLIDCVGTAARCAGPAFCSGSSTRLLRTSLLPLLERLADPCPLVSSAAAGALDSICRHSGYPLGLSQLVGANADYVVDGVCRQLRALQAHPRAPQLLAALLREAGVSAALMPLLAEPLRAALSVSDDGSSSLCVWDGGAAAAFVARQGFIGEGGFGLLGSRDMQLLYTWSDVRVEEAVSSLSQAYLCGPWHGAGLACGLSVLTALRLCWCCLSCAGPVHPCPPAAAGAHLALPVCPAVSCCWC